MNLKEAGVVWTHPRTCVPLDEIKIEYHWQGLNGQEVFLEVADADHQTYHTSTFRASSGKAQSTFCAAGKPGVHHVQLWTHLKDGREYRRHGCFRMTADSSLRTDSDEINSLFDYLREGLLQTIDVSTVNGKQITYYKAADNTRQNLAYPAYAVGGVRYFIRDMKTMFEALFEFQYPDGSLPDHVYSDDYPCPRTSRRLRSCMADLEIGTAATICKAWEAHGDDQWLSAMLPKIEASLEHVISSPATFDTEHGVIKRPHTLDEWDIHFTPAGEQGCLINDQTCYVLMQGDTACMFDASRSLSAAYHKLQNDRRASHWRRMQDHFRAIGNDLFWDGTKYRHHVHLDPFDHGDFDESGQLTMSNAWAITRGFADHEKSISIINEYLRRWKETGDRFPWWSLQPGYPDHLNYFPATEPWRKTDGYYANGGLFPLVGGELCRAAFQHGREELAVRLLHDLLSVFHRDQGALFTWYDRKGEVGINAPHNQTNYDPWGLSPWTQSLIEELAGIQSIGPCFEHARCCPRWPAAGCHEISATAHFPASDTYFSYRYELAEHQLRIVFGGTGKDVEFRILLPAGKTCQEATLNGQKIPVQIERIEQSNYLVVQSPLKGSGEIVCRF
jgi:hypothetical protein